MSFNPQQVAAINIEGVAISRWTRVDVERSWSTVFSFANFENVEASGLHQRTTMPQPMPDDSPATVTLGGHLAITGKVYRRAVNYTKNSHEVQIGIWSETRKAVDQSVKAAPGEYRNQTVQQIGSAVLAPININLIVAPGGFAAIPFPIARETPGETAIEFVERLARHRGLHLTDDQNGNLHLNSLLSPSGGGADFVEGGNIIRGHVLLQADYTTAHADNKGQPVATTDSQIASVPNAQSIATRQGATNIGGSASTPYRLLIAEHPSNSQELAARLQHQVVLDQIKTCQVTVTVDGWFDPNGQLWLNKVGYTQTKATLYSPMLIPPDLKQPSWFVYRVRSYQSDQEGTMTDITICNPLGTSAVQADNKGATIP